MMDDPNIVEIAVLVADESRAAMLTALMGGEALTATELASEAAITRQTASSHLAKLVGGNLVVVQKQGRHRYFQLASRDVAALLESLTGVAERVGASHPRRGPRDPALHKARVCYDHLAGELAVRIYASLSDRGLIQLARSAERGDILSLTAGGRDLFEEIGMDLDVLGQSRRPICRPCLDWTARRHHLAGGLGKALLELCYARRWAKRIEGTRVVRFTSRGEQEFLAAFSLDETRSRISIRRSAGRSPRRTPID
ncbi:MAG: winged helix-turn-helix domain-containing protein [Chloroflexi bacterium]|nr:winged helix-turn-helix domain-containing protein [Chloroflexota bacterium]